MSQPARALAPFPAPRPRCYPVPARFRDRQRAVVALLELDDYPAGIRRPRTWGECQAAPGPCPWVSCKHHLYLDVNPETGTIKIHFPHLEPWELEETCSLREAARGPRTLARVGDLTVLTKERVRQVELGARQTLAACHPELEALLHRVG